MDKVRAKVMCHEIVICEGWDSRINEGKIRGMPCKPFETPHRLLKLYPYFLQSNHQNSNNHGQRPGRYSKETGQLFHPG